MSYRPDVKNPYKDKEGCWEHQCFERGIICAIEALRESGKHYDLSLHQMFLENGEVNYQICIDAPCSGTVVFIPD